MSNVCTNVHAYTKTPKNPKEISKMIPPPCFRMSVSVRGSATSNGGVTQILHISHNFLSLPKLTIMINANLSNSIYQQKKAGPGLTMECGMMINNRPDSTTGIQKAVNLKKITKKMEKVSNIAEGFAQANFKRNF